MALASPPAWWSTLIRVAASAALLACLYGFLDYRWRFPLRRFVSTARHETNGSASFIPNAYLHYSFLGQRCSDNFWLALLVP
jgi:hypothetical protein